MSSIGKFLLGKLRCCQQDKARFEDWLRSKCVLAILRKLRFGTRITSCLPHSWYGKCYL